MIDPQDIIAWLVPTARGTSADKAANMLENAHRSVKTTASTFLSSRLSDLSASKPPARAIQLRFSQAPKRPGSFVLGTDPNCCDIVLPNTPGISPLHCAIGFDGQSRLVLDDFSATGTQVWYDWESSGDQIDYSWALSGTPGSQAFPDTVQRLIIDIQNVRFRLVVNDHSADWHLYRDNIEAFCELPGWVDGLTPGWDRASVSPVPPLFSDSPLFQHIIVKNKDPESVGEVYLWNVARPWEPMVKSSA